MALMNHRYQTDIFADTEAVEQTALLNQTLARNQGASNQCQTQSKNECTHFESYVDKQGNHTDYTILYMTSNTLITENDDITNIIQQIKFVEIKIVQAAFVYRPLAKMTHGILTTVIFNDKI